VFVVVAAAPIGDDDDDDDSMISNACCPLPLFVAVPKTGILNSQVNYKARQMRADRERERERKVGASLLLLLGCDLVLVVTFPSSDDDDFEPPPINQTDNFSIKRFTLCAFPNDDNNTECNVLSPTGQFKGPNSHRPIVDPSSQWKKRCFRPGCFMSVHASWRVGENLGISQLEK
jgi:hypothetical protein